MEIHLFCPKCDRYIGRTSVCSCGWRHPESVLIPLQSRWKVSFPHAVTNLFHLLSDDKTALVSYGLRNNKIGGVACVEIADSTIRWQYEVAAAVEGGAILCGRHLVLFGDSLGRLHSLQLTTGQAAWKPLSLDGAISVAPLLAQEVRAYVCTERGIIYCLDWRTGQEVWNTVLPRQPRRSRPRIAAKPVWAKEKVWIGTYDGHIYTLDGDTGHCTEFCEVESEIRTPLQVEGNLLIFGTNVGSLHIVDISSGKQILPPFYAKQGIPAAPLIRDGRIYVTSLDHYLYAIELKSGNTLWSLELTHGLATTPAWIPGGWLAIGSNGGEVVIVDTHKQDIVWHHDLSKGELNVQGRRFSVTGGPVVSASQIVIGLENGWLYAFPWHGGKWERAAELLMREGRIEEAAACLVLKGGSNAESDAANLLLSQGLAEQAAKFYQSLGRVTEAALAYEKAAAAHEGETSALLWEQATRLWLQLNEFQRADEAIRYAAKLRRDPILDFDWMRDNTFLEGQVCRVHIRLTNSTQTLARRLQIVIRGKELAPIAQERLELMAGAIWECWIDGLVPQQAGATVLYVTASCEGTQGRVITYRKHYQIEVESKKQLNMKTQTSAIRILFLAANPKDTQQLRLSEEVREIDEALLQKSEFRDMFEFQQQWAVRVTDLQSHLLRFKPHIVHFSGHGSPTNAIMLEDVDGNSKPVSSRALKTLFSTLKDNIRCVVLNACYSAEQAQVIAEQIDCVIGMSKAISDKASINFSKSFYQAIGYGRSAETAFNLGIGQIELEDINEEGVPKLIATKVDPKKIVFVSGN